MIYTLLHKRGLVSFPLTKEGIEKTKSLVANITKAYFGEEIYKTPEQKAVAYLYFIIKSHPFVDGNKRTAVLTFEVVCELNGLVPDYSGFSLDALAVYLEKVQARDHQALIKELADIVFPKNP